MVSSKKATHDPICFIAKLPVVPSNSAKCFGYWWSWDLSADKSVAVSIGKARHSFFAYGAMGASNRCAIGEA